MMRDDEQLRALIDRWEDLRQAGQEPSIEALCADCPELAEPLRDWIATLKASDWLEVSVREAAVPTNGIAADDTGDPRDLDLAPVGIAEFIDRLRASGLRPDGDLDQGDGLTGQDLARQLIERKKLTPYQAMCLCRGEISHLVLGEYIILDHLGSGGMGQVYRAIHRTMHRRVAVKTLPPSITTSKQTVRRFQREIQVIARLSHPNIATAYDAGQAKGVHFLAMELIEGQVLNGLVRRSGPLPIEQAVDIAVQVAQGLAYAHQSGVVHRDIKPSNLILDANGTVKILDLGVATLRPQETVSAEKPESLTDAGAIIGTMDYMAPEQSFDSSRTDHRADIYSLGCTLYFLLTGKLVYDGETPVARLLAHRDKPVPSLRESRPEVSAKLDQVYQRMVAKRPEDRYRSMDAVIQALKACPVEAIDRAGRPGRKTNRWLVGAATVCALALVGWLVGILLKIETPHGTLVLEIEQPNAQIDIDGANKISLMSKADGGPVEVRLRDGEYTIRVTRSGFAEHREVVVLSGERTQVRIRLQPLPVSKALSENTSPMPDRPDAQRSKPSSENVTPTPGQPDPQRAAAKWILASGGSLTIRQAAGPKVIASAAELPDGPIVVEDVYLQNNAKFSDEQLARLEPCFGLRQAHFGSTAVTGTGLKYLRQPGVLWLINLWGTALNDEGLEQVGRFTRLAHLNIGSNRGFSNAGLRHLTKLTHLEGLELGLTNLTDEGLECITPLSNLSSISLHNTKITDAGLVHLKMFPRLDELKLMNTGVTDAGLEHLKVLAKLKKLDLSDTQVTAEGLRTLHTALPDCEITKNDQQIPPEAVEFKGHKYRFVQASSISWKEAKEACEKLGGHLVCLETDEELEIVNKVRQGVVAWVGGCRHDDGQWRWLNGQVIPSGRVQFQVYPLEKKYFYVSVFGNGAFECRPESSLAPEKVEKLAGYVCEWE